MNNEQRKARTNALGAPQGQNYPEYPYSGETGYTGAPYGGAGGSTGGGSPQQQYPVPYNGGGTQPSKPFGSGFNFNEIKNMVDRMGGVDGVLNMMQKANKMMQTVQQMAPMLKLFMGSFGSKASTADSYDEDDYYPKRRRRRRKRRRSGSSRRRTARRTGSRRRRRR